MKADYIIVGAGSAGCVLANRLSADPGTSVLLLEAGPPNTALSLKIPAAMTTNLNGTKHNWSYKGEPEAGLGGRSLKHDRGKTLGGSSSINGMVFIRGHARDFDTWQQMGCKGWSYADVLPYFKRLENYSGGGSDHRGTDGPMQIKRPEGTGPIYKAFLEAGKQAGYPLTDDICGEKQEGFGLLDQSTYNGERWSAARAYLDPARSRPNLTIKTDVLVRRLVLDGNRATGVEFQTANGKVETATAGKEVILSAGAVGTPHVLMLSGIGPADHLRDKGIDVVRDAPGVGSNLNEHPDFVLKYRSKKPVTLYPYTKGVRKLAAGVQWLLTKDGVCASNHFEAVACIRSGPGVDYPDLQISLSPIAMKHGTWEPIPEEAFQIHVGLMRAHSRGKIRLKDAKPETPPSIKVNYLDDPRDRDLLRKGARLVRELVSQPAFSDLCGEEIFPGKEAQTDDELDRKLAEAVDTQWHLTCTAKMGAESDPMAVVDPTGKVYGIKGLRIVDASIMPQVTNGNTNCPTIMIAEKLSDAIVGKPPLPRNEAEIWQNPNWETAQR